MPPRQARTVHFIYMGAYWSCTSKKWDDLVQAMYNRTTFSLEDCRQLETRPRGYVYRLKEAV